MAHRHDSQKNVFGNATTVASVILALVFIADVSLAVKAGLYDQPAICGVASVGR